MNVNIPNSSVFFKSVVAGTRGRGRLLREESHVEVRAVEQQGALWRGGGFVCFVEEFEESGADVHWDAHDDAFRDATN